MSSSPAAVVRVKRKRTDDPVAALVLSFKKSRNDVRETYSDLDHTADEVFRFTGTAPLVNSQGDETKEQLKRILINGKISVSDRIVRARERPFHKLHVADVRLKCKREKEEAAKQQRDNLLLSLRSIDMREMNDDDDEDEEEKIDKAESVFDIGDRASASTTSISDITCNDHRLVRVRQSKSTKDKDEIDIDPEIADPEYVYDYYVSSNFCDDNEIDDRADVASGAQPRRKRTSTNSSSGTAAADVTEYFQNLIAVYPYNLCDEAIDNGANADNFQLNFDQDSDDDDEDSNAESNWRNEYPDEDEDFENRYDFYDQTYPNRGDGEDFDDDEESKDDFSVLDHMKMLKLGTRDDDDEENRSEDQIDFGNNRRSDDGSEDDD